MDTNSTKNQQIKRLFVDREVFANVNDIIEFILTNDSTDCPFSYDDIENLFVYPEHNGVHSAFRGGTEEDLNEEIERLNELIEETASGATIANIEAEVIELENLEQQSQDIFEWWLVSSFLGDKLIEIGEPVIKREYGGYIWGRTTTGQAILLDYAISQICQDMEILEGQKSEWEV